MTTTYNNDSGNAPHTNNITGSLALEPPKADPIEHDNPEIDELEDNEPIEQPEIYELTIPEREIDETEQGDIEPSINN